MVPLNLYLLDKVMQRDPPLIEILSFVVAFMEFLSALTLTIALWFPDTGKQRYSRLNKKVGGSLWNHLIIQLLAPMSKQNSFSCPTVGIHLCCGPIEKEL
jgi:hypothetical protein